MTARKRKRYEKETESAEKKTSTISYIRTYTNKYTLRHRPSTLFNSKVARSFAAKRTAGADAVIHLERRVRIEKLKLRAVSPIEKNTRKTILKWEKPS